MIGPLRHAFEMVRSSCDGDVLHVDSREILDSVIERVHVVRAFWHPLGFVHAELTELLEERSAGLRMRLHVWHSSVVQSDALGLIHDHAWQLKSLVLVGELTDLSIEASVDSGGSHDAIRVTYGPEHDFHHESRVNLHIARRRRVQPGQVYHIPSRAIHETVIDVAPVVTLLVAQEDPPGSPGPLVFTPHHSTLSGTPVRVPVPHRNVARILRDALASGAC